MEFFKKRSNAVVIFVVVVILFSLIGCHRSLSKACGQVEDTFFEKGALSGRDYYTCPGDQLANCVNYANRLLSAINGSDELTEAYAAIRDSRAALDEALEDRDISDIYEANQALVQAVSMADEQVKAGASLPEGSDYNSIVSDFFAAQSVADSSPYNDYVDEFIDTTIHCFPTNILRALSFVSLPEKYA